MVQNRKSRLQKLAFIPLSCCQTQIDGIICYWWQNKALIFGKFENILTNVTFLQKHSVKLVTSCIWCKWEFGTKANWWKLIMKFCDYWLMVKLINLLVIWSQWRLCVPFFMFSNNHTITQFCHYPETINVQKQLQLNCLSIKLHYLASYMTGDQT